MEKNYAGAGLAQSRIGREVDPVRDPSIPSGISRLQNQSAALTSIVERLETRLSDVCRAGPTTNSASQLESAAPCGMANALEAICDNVASASYRIESMLDRLEL